MQHRKIHLPLTSRLCGRKFLARSRNVLKKAATRKASKEQGDGTTDGKNSRANCEEDSWEGWHMQLIGKKILPNPSCLVSLEKSEEGEISSLEFYTTLQECKVPLGVS